MDNTTTTFDVVFHDSTSSQEKGWMASLEYCQHYIKFHNGTYESYFLDYSGGIVEIVCNETGKVIETHYCL